MAARIIVRVPYLKDGDSVSGYTKYIATREGVDKSIYIKYSDKPETKNQKALIEKMLCDCPDMEYSYEFEAYEENRTRANASLLLTAIMEQQAQLFGDPGIYTKYIATRPGAEMRGAHGLFGNGKQPALPEVLEELKQHTGNVWTPIISLRREDAERLGFDSAQAWQNLLMEKQTELAQAFKIPLKNFRWYAAFHNEAHHPHVHMLIYSTQPKQGFITEEGIEKIKSSLATQIFKQDLYQLYDNKDEMRKKISQVAEQRLEGLRQAVAQKDYSDSPITDKLVELAFLLRDTGGKKQYAYLKPTLKRKVDEIVREMFADRDMAALYSCWCEYQNEITGIYRGNAEQPALWENKEFRNIKNKVIAKAVELIEKLQDEAAAKDVQVFLDASEITKRESPLVFELAGNDCGSAEDKKRFDETSFRESFQSLHATKYTLQLMTRLARLLTPAPIEKSRPKVQIDRKILNKIAMKKRDLGWRW